MRDGGVLCQVRLVYEGGEKLQSLNDVYGGEVGL